MNKTPKVNINLASLEELTSVPGLGNYLAEQIIARRPFSSLDDLTHIKGIGAGSIERLRPNLTVSDGWDDLPGEPEFTLPDNEPLKMEILDEEVIADEEGIIETIQTEPDISSENNADAVEIQAEQVESLQAEPVLDEIEEEAIFVPVEEIMNEQANAPILDNQIDADILPEADTASPQEEKPKSKATAASKNQTKTEPAITRNQLIGSVLLTAFLTTLLTVLLTLGILAAINGGLQYASFNSGAQMQSDLIRLTDRSDTLRTDVDGVRNRLDILETVAGRVSALETTTKSMQSDLSTAQKNLEQFGVSLEEAQQQILLLQKSTQNFQSFINDVATAAQQYADPAAAQGNGGE